MFIVKQQQISTNISKHHEIQTNITTYHQLAEPEVCLWRSRDQIYHRCDTNISMTLLPQAPSNINNFCQVATNINKHKQISRNTNKYHHRSANINKHQQIREPEVSLWPSRDQMYHIWYAQTTNRSMTLLPQAPSNINKCCQIGTNINTYQQISIHTSKQHEIPTNINNYHNILTNISKYQQIAEPEVCPWSSRDKIYHIRYAQTRNISMTLLPQAPLNINNYCQVATNINKCKQTS